MSFMLVGARGVGKSSLSRAPAAEDQPDGAMRIGERYAFAREQQARYAAAGKAERSRILDAFCLAIGYHRKYAMAVLRRRKRLSVCQEYGLEFRKGLSDGVGGILLHVLSATPAVPWRAGAATRGARPPRNRR